jgi:hypothetical protein
MGGLLTPENRQKFLDEVSKPLESIRSGSAGTAGGPPKDTKLKSLEMDVKLASEALAIQNLSMSNAEKSGTIHTKDTHTKKLNLELAAVEAEFLKKTHLIEKEKEGNKKEQLAKAKDLRDLRKEELSIASELATVQSEISKSTRDYAVSQRSAAEGQALASLNLAKGLVTTEATILKKDADRKADAEALIKKLSVDGKGEVAKKGKEEDLKAANSAKTILDSNIATEKVLRDQVSDRNKLNNQAYLYSEYMKKAIEEGATLADFTSAEVNGESLVLEKMQQQLVELNKYSGAEKTAAAERLRFETDQGLKDAQKLERKRVLRNLEQEIDKIGTAKLTKDRVIPVIADESFARFEDFRNKMRGVITGTFDAVYKGMDTAIDSLTTKMMKNQKFNARDILRDFGNAAAEEFRQMAADRMKLQFRTMVTNTLGGGDREEARAQARAQAIFDKGLDVKGIIAKQASEDAKTKSLKDAQTAGKDITDAKVISTADKAGTEAAAVVNSATDVQVTNNLLQQIVNNTGAMASSNLAINDKTQDPTKAVSPAIVAAEAAKAKAVSKLATSDVPVTPTTPASGWTDAGSTRNMVGNSLIGGVSGLLMAQMAGQNNKLAPWIAAIGGGLLSGLMGQKGGIMGMFGGNKFADGGIMSSAGSLPLHKYANGGVAATPQLALFGEGRLNEAYVPLPDGRTIPVSMKSPMGGGVNNVSSQSNQVTVHVNPTTGTTSTNASGMDPNMMQQLGSSIGAKVREELMFQKRPGGLLY